MDKKLNYLNSGMIKYNQSKCNYTGLYDAKLKSTQVKTKEKKILITGASGFVGRSLVLDLLDQGYANIYILVRNTSDISFLKEGSVKVLYGDVGDKESLFAIEDKFDVIYHCAGYVNNKDRDLLWRINVLGTENVCELAMAHNVERLIYVSSVAVISGNFDVPLNENLPYKATNLYGESKLEAERVAVNYMKGGLPMVIVRPPMIYGEDEPHMLSLLLSLIKKRIFFLPDKGQAKFHLAYVKNVSWFLAECLENSDVLGDTYFIADNEVLTGHETFAEMARVMGVKNPLRLPFWLTPLIVKLPVVGRSIKFFVKDREYSIDKLKNELGLKPPYSVYEGLENTVLHWMSKV